MGGQARSVRPAPDRGVEPDVAVAVRALVGVAETDGVAVGVAVGVAFLSVIPLWSWRTTGDWRETPLAAYRRDYLPFDRLGFSVDSTRPARGLR